MKATRTQSIFEPLVFGELQLKNAVVMAPMTRSRAIGTIPNDLMAKYYAQRATAGLIVTEGTSPSANGIGYARTPGIYSKEQVNGWKKVTEAVHEKGGKIFLQLMHVGRVAHGANMPEDARIIAPSAIPAEGTIWTDQLGMQNKGFPEEMTIQDIINTKLEFVLASENAIEAGFDGIELHGANGYLLEQFLNPHANQRGDEYGGSIENRARFVLEVAQAVADAVGKNRVGVRVSPYSIFNDMPAYDEIFKTYSYLTKQLAKLDLLYLHVVDYAARKSDEGLQLLSEVRRSFPNLLIVNGGYNKERAEKAREEIEADLISFGSLFLANPDLPFRLKNGLPLNTPDGSTFYTADAKGYVDYPVA